MKSTEHLWWEVNTGSGNGLVPSDNKPLPEPMLTQILATIGCEYRPKWVKQVNFYPARLVSDNRNIDQDIRLKTNTLQWRHNERDGVSNNQHHDCLFNRLFRRRSRKTSKLRVTGLCVGNSPVTGEFPVQRASWTDNSRDVGHPRYNDVVCTRLWYLTKWNDRNACFKCFEILIIISICAKSLHFECHCNNM